MSKPPRSRTGKIVKTVTPADEPDEPPPGRASSKVRAHADPSGAAPQAPSAKGTKTGRISPPPPQSTVNPPEDTMAYKCPNCGEIYQEKPEGGMCPNPKCMGAPVEPYDVNIIQGLCLLACDASLSMDDKAFADKDTTKLQLVTRAVHQAILEIAHMTDPDQAFVGLLAFGKQAAFIPTRQGEPFLMSVTDITGQYSDDLHSYLFDCLRSDKLGLDRSYTDMSAGLRLAWDVCEGALSGNLSRFRKDKAVDILKHKDITRHDTREQINVPNVRVLFYSDGQHNPPPPVEPVENPFSALDPSPLITAFIGSESASEDARRGSEQLLELANTCPEHNRKGYFPIETPETYVKLRMIFHMASGASGFCPACLEKFIRAS